jgi:hypothetical protein
MKREEYINYPALSASGIKRHYTGDLKHIRKALDAGASLHQRLLEVQVEHYDSEAANVYRAINDNPIAAIIFNNARYEVPAVTELVINSTIIPAKAMYDIINKEAGVIADVKTTKAKTLKAFQSDMIRHYNHIQAVWYCMVANIEPDKFYYIGVTERSRTDSGSGLDIFIHRHSQQEIEQAYELINGFILSNKDKIVDIRTRYELNRKKNLSNNSPLY